MNENMNENLKEYSSEQLIKELERRKNEDSNEDVFFVCIGIIDDLGVESIVPVKTYEEFSITHNSLSLRTRFNSHRNAKVYSIRVNQSVFDTINKVLKSDKYNDATEMIKNLSTFKIIVS